MQTLGKTCLTIGNASAIIARSFFKIEMPWSISTLTAPQKDLGRERDEEIEPENKRHQRTHLLEKKPWFQSHGDTVDINRSKKCLLQHIILSPRSL